MAVAVSARQSTAFSYQGKLVDGGTLANGNYDLQFRLFDALVSGVQVGSTLVRDDVQATNGIFAVTLDFGASEFPGANRWLEVSVRPGASVGSFTSLSPLQPISSTPYAIQSLNAATANALSPACAGCVTGAQIGSLPTDSGNYIQNSATLQANSDLNISGNGFIGGKVGIGTTTPAHALQVNGTTSLGAPGGVYGFSIDGALPGPYPSLGFNAFYDATSFSYFGGVGGYGGIFQFQDGDGKFGYYNTPSPTSAGGQQSFTPRFTILQNGNVGIGVDDPLAKLQIDGGSTIGVHSHSTDRFGVSGASDTAPGVVGVSGTAAGVSGYSQNGAGIQGVSTKSHGVYGETANSGGLVGGVYGKGTGGASIGVYGHSDTGAGVFGESDSGEAVYGISLSGAGLRGRSGASSLTAAGVYGQGIGPSTIGVIGESNNYSFGVGVFGVSTNAAGVGVYGRNPSGRASVFEGSVAIANYGGSPGNLSVAGTVSKGGGSFKIDHPLDPENKYLYHSFVESPDMMNIYNGNLTTDANGDATVTMPEWFEALNRDFRYQLTVIGQFAQAIVAEEITGNHFKLKTSLPEVKVSWQVTGVRQDAFANKYRIPVEELKPDAERGTYLHADAFNQAEEKSLEWARRPEQMRETHKPRELWARRTKQQDKCTEVAPITSGDVLKANSIFVHG
jgi:hypothetical protein